MRCVRALRGRSSNGSTAEEARAAAEGVALTEANIVRTCRRLDVLAARIRSVEERSSAR